MKEILETAATVKRLGLKWTNLLSRHSVAVSMIAENRNIIAGEVYETRAALDCALSHIEDATRRVFYPSPSEADDDTLQICALQGLQVND